jgi:hypothetical protein
VRVARKVLRMARRRVTSADEVERDTDVVYRSDRFGNRVSVLPATCRAGLHQLGQVGYRALERGRLVVISCALCAAEHPGRPQRHAWVLRISGPPTQSAELDDIPYLRLVADTPLLTQH